MPHGLKGYIKYSYLPTYESIRSVIDLTTVALFCTDINKLVHIEYMASSVLKIVNVNNNIHANHYKYFKLSLLEEYIPWDMYNCHIADLPIITMNGTYIGSATKIIALDKAQYVMLVQTTDHQNLHISLDSLRLSKNHITLLHS